MWTLPILRDEAMTWSESKAGDLVIVASPSFQNEKGAQELEDACHQVIRKAGHGSVFKFERFLSEAPPGAKYIIVVFVDASIGEGTQDQEHQRRCVEAWAVRHHPDALILVKDDFPEKGRLTELIAILMGMDKGSLSDQDYAPDEGATIQTLSCPTSPSSLLPTVGLHEALYSEVEKQGSKGLREVLKSKNDWKLKNQMSWALSIPRIDPPHKAKTMSIESSERARCFVPQPSDVIIATAPKSGTTMLQWICHLLRTEGGTTPGALDFVDIYQPSPWIELSWDFGFDPYVSYNDSFVPRQYKSHHRLASVQPGAKYIVTVRDPGSIVISYYNFLREKGVPEVCESTLGEFLRCEDIADGQMFGARLWDYFYEYYQCRNDPSVLCLVFEDFLTDSRTQIRAIAEFMEIENITEELIDRVTAGSTKEAMRKHASKFDESWASKEIVRLNRSRMAVHFAESTRVVTKKHKQTFDQDDQEFLQNKWKTIITDKLGFETYDDLAQAVRESLHERFNLA